MNSVNILLNKIKKSFILSYQGQEKLSVVIYFWGMLLLILFIFIINPILSKIDNIFIRIIIIIFAILCCIWHIFVIKRCTPKLTKIDKQKINPNQKSKFMSQFGKKIFLKEPITKPRPSITTAAIDIYFIMHYIHIGFFS